MEYAAASTSYISVDNGGRRDYTSKFKTETFKSKEDLVKWARQVGRLHGFVVITLRSDSGKGSKRPRVTLACERSGKCYSPSTSEEKKSDKYGRGRTGTKKCDCPFRLMGKKLANGDCWKLIVVKGIHNHEVENSEKQLGHSSQGRLSQEEKLLVKDLRKEGKQPKEILRVLQKRDKHNKSTLRTIYNACQHLDRIQRRSELQVMSSRKADKRRSPLQQVMSKAEEYGFIKKQRTSPKMDTASDLFLTHTTCLELLHAFPTVFIIDFTGRCWLSASDAWLKIFGVASTGTYFSIGVAILRSNRTSSSYEWALSSLHGVINDYGITMPDIVILHNIEIEIELAYIMKAVSDVFSTAKLLFTGNTIRHRVFYRSYALKDVQWNSFDNKWELLVESPTEADWKENIMQLRTEVPDSVIDTLVKPYKEMFVAAWTDKVMHFGNTKPFPYLFMGTMCEMMDNYRHLLEVINEFWEELHGLIEKEKARVKALLEKSLENEYNDQDGFSELKELHGTISIHALDIIRKEAMLAKEMDDNHRENCSCAIRSTHGLPCAHVIAKYRREGPPIPPEFIHSHWRTLELKPLRKTGEPNNVLPLPDIHSDNYSDLALPDIVESKLNSLNPGSSMVHSAQHIQPDDEVYNIQSTKLLELVDVCPPVLRTYILDVKDVPRDGHCGFTVIASLLGIADDDGWPGWAKVRTDLRKELKFNPDHYAHLFGSKQEVDDLLLRLDYFQITCPEKDHWMLVPEMGHVIASCYGVVLMHLSSVQNQCFTFFPLKFAPTSVSLPAEIAIGFSDEHFVQVLFKEMNVKHIHPMPPPAALLTKKEPSDFDRHQQLRCKEWAARYGARIKQFGSSSSLHPIVHSHENPIDLDTDCFMDNF